MLIPRPKYLKKIEKALQSVPIAVLIGARQVGKTSLLKLYVQDKSGFLWIDGQLPDNQQIFSNFNSAIQFLKIHLNKQLKGLVIIDEFHFIPNISEVLKALVDNHTQLKFLCSGSSSIDIFGKIQESLAGRVRFISVYALSFDEYLRFLDRALFEEYQKYDLFTGYEIISRDIKEAFDDYLIYGGLPAIVLEADYQEKIQKIYDIYTSYLLKDVKHFVKFEDSVRFNKLVSLLAVQIGNLLNFNNISKESGLSYHKTQEYISLLEQMFILRLVRPYFINKQNVIKKSPKVFFLDLGLRNMLVKDFRRLDLRQDKGCLYENFVFLELIKNLPDYTEINFFRTKDGTEVDFIIQNLNEIITIEVKASTFNKPSTIKALKNFNSVLKSQKSFVINQNFNFQHTDYQFLPAILTNKIKIFR